MNLENLFQTQKILRDRINYNKPDRFDKLILALLVELGELANEWRGFKFWSKDQTPRTRKARGPYVDLEDAEFYNPLLEEYVDGLHFVLEIGLEAYIYDHVPTRLISFTNNITTIFNSVFKLVSSLRLESLLLSHRDYKILFNEYLHLGEMLGFTWNDIETAYMTKNSINIKRQEEGY